MEYERDSTKAHMARLLRLNKKQTIYLEILVCLALVVAAVVPLGLRQRGVATTPEESHVIAIDDEDEVAQVIVAGNVKVAREAQDKALDGETVVNSPKGGSELPATGGSGVEAFTLTGILMMLVGSVGLLVRRIALAPREAYGSWESDCNELRKGASEWRHLV